MKIFLYIIKLVKWHYKVLPDISLNFPLHYIFNRKYTLGVYRKECGQQEYSISYYKNRQKYYATMTNRQRVTLNAPGSDVSLQVADGLKTFVSQHIYTNFEDIKFAIPAKECIISPVVRFHTKDTLQGKVTDNYKFTATIPHCLAVGSDLSVIKVRSGKIQRKQPLKEVPKGCPDDAGIQYFTADEKYITLYTNHFCDVVCTSEKQICNTSLVILPFGYIYPDEDEQQTYAKVKVFLCSYLFNLPDYRLVS